MPTLDVVVPPMGESISSGVLAKWHVQNGDLVKKDQILYELETDKITSEGLAEANGRITLAVAAGVEVKIGQKVAELDTEAAPAAASGQPPSTSAGATASKPPAPQAQPAKQAPQDTAILPPFPATPPTTQAAAVPSAVVASPAVRRLAVETGINPSTLQGTGKGGRVTKEDMLAAAERTGAGARPELKGDRAPSVTGAPSAVAQAGAAAVANSRQTRRKLSPLRARIAQRLIAAQHDAAMLTTFNEVDMSAVMALRAKHQEEFTKRNGTKLGFMSFFVKAVVRALQEVPAVNTQLDGDTIVENHFFDVGVAVSTDKGLLVPVIRDCDKLTMAQVEKSLGEAATKAREGKISLADLEGGVFTITNGGIFGSLLSTPIINPPQCAILGMHAIQDRPVVRDGQIVVRPMMYLALSYDHRLVDGREAVTFLVKVKQAIEDPTRLLLSL